MRNDSVAQLDRATAFYAVGRGFESLLDHLRDGLLRNMVAIA